MLYAWDVLEFLIEGHMYLYHESVLIETMVASNSSMYLSKVCLTIFHPSYLFIYQSINQSIYLSVYQFVPFC